MKLKSQYLIIAAFAALTARSAHSSELDSLIRLAQERSSRVKAAESLVQARTASLSGARSTVSPTLEIAPGVGYTNGNSVLSQEIDIYGRRAAASNLASVSVRMAQLGVARAKAEVSFDVLNTYAQLLGTQDELQAASAAVESAKSLLAAVRKLNEIGEAPKVHITRAELDVIRAEQLVAIATGRNRTAQAAFVSLIGDDAKWQDATWPQIEATSARPSSFDVLEANAEIEFAEAQVHVIRSNFGPTLSAGLATDIWSLDRNQFRRDNIGLQLSFRIPLFDGGQKRGAIQASQSEVAAARAQLSEAQRVADLQFASASTAHATALAILRSYEGDVLPKGEAMLVAMREGYSAGLVTLVEVLEAHQTLTKLRQERNDALVSFRLAEIALWKTTMTLPGAEVAR